MWDQGGLQFPASVPGRGPYRQQHGPDIRGEARDTRILTHTSAFPYKAGGLDGDEERKDRALVDVGGCLLISFRRFTFSTAHLLILSFLDAV